MGNLTCNRICIKPVKSANEEEKEEYIPHETVRYENDNEKKESYSIFSQKFEKKLKYIGKYVLPTDFENILSDKAHLYMIQNVLDLPKNISANKKSFQMKPIEFKNGNIYNGCWNEKYKMDGYGQYYLKTDKLFVEGIWDDGKLIYGRIFFPNDDIYEGQINDSLFNGKGKLISKNGDIYEGEFSDGEKNGKGKFIFNDETIYEGEVSKGLFNGKGKIKWKNNIEYNGLFIGNKLIGYGKLTNNLGEKYEGNFLNNKFNGKGTYTYDSGSIYFGDFESGIKKGKGTYKRFDGFIYEGYWDNDLANGFGKITYKNCVIESVWKDGKIVEEPNFLVGKEEIFDNKDLNFETESFKLDADKYTHLEYNKMLEENKEFNSSESCSNPSFLRESLY